MVQGFANMNLGMNTMVQNKPRGRGGYGGGGGRGGERGDRRGDRGGHTREREAKLPESKEVQSGRELAKMCNPELKSVNPEDFVVPDFARMFVIKS